MLQALPGGRLVRNDAKTLRVGQSSRMVHVCLYAASERSILRKKMQMLTARLKTR